MHTIHKVTCGNLSCKCGLGERHGPLGRGCTTGGIPADKVDQVGGWIDQAVK